MRTNTRTHIKRHGAYGELHEAPLRGRRHPESAPNSLQFFAMIEGVDELDGHVRGANGIRWRLP